MLKVVYDKETRVIELLAKVGTPSVPTAVSSVMDITIDTDGLSETQEAIEIEDEDTRIVNCKYDMDAIIRDVTKFVFDTERGFLLKPVISILVDGALPENGTVLKKIKTDVELTIKYNDPDDVGFQYLFDNVKFKDREYLVPINEVYTLDDKLEHKLTVRSDWPGVSTFRAKDNKYLSVIATSQIRWIP